MSESSGFSVRIFMPSGQPAHLRIIEKSNWNGQGLVFPRNIFKEPEVKNREELKDIGVYVIWGPDDPDNPDDLEQLPPAYVGEGEILDRLQQHQRKDFWTHAVVFRSKDQSLNKAHVQHLEARLCQLAKEAKRCELDNRQTPQEPSLSPADMADAELYLADMLLCLRVIGVNFFDKPPESTEKSQILFFKATGIEAKGFVDAEGFVVLAGSTANKNETGSIPSNRADLRKTLLIQGIFEDTGTEYRLTEDYLFSSSSAAAGVLAGGSYSGPKEWKDANGRSLQDIQKEEVTPNDESDIE